MNNSQRAKLEALTRVEAFLNENADKIKIIDEYADEKNDFNTQLDLARKAAQVQSTTTAATHDEVQIKKETMAAIVIRYALRGVVKANRNGDTTLANHLNHTENYIVKATKLLAVQRATDIKDYLQNNLTALTNIKQENIDEMVKAIHDYDIAKDKPVADIQARTASGTNPLPSALTNAFEKVDAIENLLHSYFPNDKEFLDKFALARAIIITGIHHTGVTGTVKKNNAPLAGASVSLVNTKKVAITDANGHYTIAKVKTGDYTIEASTQGGDSASKTVHITKGDFEIVDFSF